MYVCTKFLQHHKFDSTNSVIMGDLNDFLVPEMDYWSNQKQTSQRTLGTVLQPLRRVKFHDAFRITHPEQKVYSRIGSYNDQGILSEKRITMTRLDYILTSFPLIQQMECIAILDGFNIGPDHRPVLA